MSEESKIIPEGTVLAYSKVSLEYQALGLEINKLESFLENPKYVSDKMCDTMKVQLSEMKNYHGTLGYRLTLFQEENPGISEYQNNSKGSEIIGQFNPSGDKQVEEIKNRSAQLINCVDAFGKDPRRKAIAITKIEEAQMMAVKSIFN